MAANREAKMKQALITKLVELLESNGIMREFINPNLPKKQTIKTLNVMGADTIFHHGIKTILTLTEKTAQLDCFSDVQSHLGHYWESTNRHLDLTTLTLEQLQTLQTKFENLVSKLDIKEKGACARNKVVHYLNNLNEPIDGLDAEKLIKNMDDLRQAQRFPNATNEETRRTLANEIAFTAYDLSSSKHKHRALAVLIISFFAITALVPPVLAAYLACFYDGDKKHTGKLSLGMRVVNFVSNHLKEASTISKASKSMLFFTQQVQKPAGSNEHQHSCQAV